MTVADLQNKLAKFPADTRVAVYWEDGNEHQIFGIDDISLATGTPCRDENTRRAGFKFEGTGPSTWLFVSISPE